MKSRIFKTFFGSHLSNAVTAMCPSFLKRRTEPRSATHTIQKRVSSSPQAGVWLKICLPITTMETEIICMIIITLQTLSMTRQIVSKTFFMDFSFGVCHFRQTPSGSEYYRARRPTDGRGLFVIQWKYLLDCLDLADYIGVNVAVLGVDRLHACRPLLRIG